VKPPAETVDVTGKWQSKRVTVKQTVTFTSDGKVFGNAGCNDFSGTYKVRSWFITISPLATTLRACDAAVMDAEAAFLGKLQTATRAERACTQLRLDVSGGLLVLEHFRKPGESPIDCVISTGTTTSGNARPFGGTIANGGTGTNGNARPNSTTTN
jgi:heat shock protein HslJ